MNLRRQFLFDKVSAHVFNSCMYDAPANRHPILSTITFQINQFGLD